MVDIEMLKEMVMYITENCHHKSTFAYTHLNKILHYSDLHWFGEHGKSISLETYVKEKFGAIPVHVKDAEKELKGYLKIQKNLFKGKEQNKPIAIKSYPYRKLTEEQKKHIDKFINKFADWTAVQVQEYAKSDLAYKILNKGEEIPPNSIFFLKQTKKEDVTEDDLKWANDVIVEYEKELS